jgi:phosphohistidine phosphatase SixA
MEALDPSSPARRGFLLGAAALVGAPGALATLASHQDPAPPAPSPPAPSPAGQPVEKQAAVVRTVRVVLVRHAEKSADPGPDPGLSDAGRARAELLARMLAKAGVTHLFSSQFKRATQTAEPLAKLLKLEPKLSPAGDTLRVAELVRDLPHGSLAVVIGHSNTVPVIVRAFGASLRELQPDGNFPDADFDRFVAVTLSSADGTPPQAIGALELRY